MGKLVLRFVGVNAYVPHQSGGSMMVVLPNASGLGSSPPAAPDGTRVLRHLPMVYEEAFIPDRRLLALTQPEVFPGSRLWFRLTVDGQRPPLNLSGIQHLINAAWLDVPSPLLALPPTDLVSAQVLIDAGTVTEFQPRGAGGCPKVWSETFSKSIVPVVAGVDVTVDKVTRVEAVAYRWVLDTPMQVPILERDMEGEDVRLLVGNQCSEDGLNWPRNSSGGFVTDNDFKWIFRVAQDDAEINAAIAAGRLPAPIVPGSSGIDATDSPFAAFRLVYGGGGGLGCECNGLIGPPKGF